MSTEFINTHYYIISITILLLAIGAFFLSFEKRKPQAKEIITIAVMSAIAVASRAAFVMLPFFKPMCAIVMITGMAFGSCAGFLTGSLGALVSNFIFGQGPWTPWQMLAYGIAGALAGIMRKRGWIMEEKPLRTGVTGFLIVVVIVGPILDTFSVFSMANVFSVKDIDAIYLSGLPVNVVHGVATFVTLYFLCKPMIEKLNRIKMKYGMMDGGENEI